jgi:hypothetical protein
VFKLTTPEPQSSVVETFPLWGKKSATVDEQLKSFWKIDNNFLFVEVEPARGIKLFIR